VKKLAWVAVAIVNLQFWCWSSRMVVPYESQIPAREKTEAQEAIFVDEIN
jgi:hypothetical protein